MITARMEREMVAAARGATNARDLDFSIYHLAQLIADTKQRTLHSSLGLASALSPEKRLKEAVEINRLARVLYASTSRALDLTKKGGRRA